MKNYKLENNLGGDEYWPNIPFVAVKGIPGQESALGIEDNSKREKVIQKWNDIAVLKVTGEKSAKFFVGFLKEKRFQYFKHELVTDMEFGMRVGPEDVKFFVLPLNFEDNLKLELMEIIKEDDPKYQDLILI